MTLEKNHNHLQEFADTIAAETRRCYVLKNSGSQVSTQGLVHKFTLPEYTDALQDLSGDGLFDESLLQQKLEYFRKREFEFQEKFPSGVKVVLAVLPCNDNGSLYNEDDMKEGQHLRLLLVDPRTGLSIYGDTLPAMMPSEIISQCSFSVEYADHASLPSAQDLKKFYQNLQGSFVNLKKLLGRSDKSLN